VLIGVSSCVVREMVAFRRAKGSSSTISTSESNSMQVPDNDDEKSRAKCHIVDGCGSPPNAVLMIGKSRAYFRVPRTGVVDGFARFGGGERRRMNIQMGMTRQQREGS